MSRRFSCSISFLPLLLTSTFLSCNALNCAFAAPAQSSTVPWFVLPPAAFPTATPTAALSKPQAHKPRRKHKTVKRTAFPRSNIPVLAVGSQPTLKQLPSAGRTRHHTHAVNGGTESMKISSHRPVSHGAVDVVNRQMLNDFVSGTNPLEVLGRTTPGAYFSSDDALGLDTATSTFYLRGFNLSQLGATLDGIPMGIQGFTNWYGVSVNQMAIQENISSLAISQGAGALDVPSAQMLGGALTYTTSDPSHKVGGQLSQQFGSFNGFRTFARVDSGDLNETGTRFYAAFNRTDQNMWTGYGYQKEYMGNFKLVQPVNERSRITFTFDYSNFSQYNYLGMTQNMWNVLGHKAHNFKPDYNKALTWAGCTQGLENGPWACPSGVPAGVTGLSPDEVSDLSYAQEQIQRNALTALAGDFQLTDSLRSHTLGYGQVSSGWYGGSNPFLTSPSSGVPMAEMGDKPTTRRIGFVQDFDITLPQHNKIKTGIWYENNALGVPADLYQDGLTAAHPSMHHLSDPTVWWKDQFSTNTFQFYTQDTWTIIPNMTLLAGFKSLTQTTHGGTKWDHTAQMAAAGWTPYYSHPANGSLTAAAAFLPHFNWDWRFGQNKQHELYWDIAENMRAYDYSFQSGGGTPWGGLGNSKVSAQSVFNTNKRSLKPERTWNYVVGYRYNGEIVSAAVDYYHTDYYNRLGAITSGSFSNPTSAYANLGRESMNGVDALFTLSPFRHGPAALAGLSLTNSFSYNRATYQNSHVPNGSGFVNIKGSQQVYYPEYMYKVDLRYAWHHFTVNLNANYSSARYLTYTNDQKIAPYWGSQLTAGYDFGRIGQFTQHLRANFGVANLFNQSYAGGIHGAAALSGDNNPVLYSVAPREFFGTVKAEF